MNWPPLPGPGIYAIRLDTAPFYVLVALLALFALLLGVLRHRHPQSKRPVEGFLEAAGVDIAFLAFSFALVVGLAYSDPYGNRTAFALYSVILQGYWLAFSIPIVTVGSSVHSRTRGTVPWLVPSVAVAAILFLGFFAYYFGR